MRIDANVSFENGIDEMPLRLKDAISDMKHILNEGASLTIIGHRGRPKGQEQSLSLKPLVSFLEKHLDRQVDFLKGIQLPPANSRVILLENIRFFDGELKNKRGFAKRLSEMGDMYVNNAFGVSHRKQASLHKITKFLPSYAGSSVKREIEGLELLKKAKSRILILGGIKLSTKIPLIENLADSVEFILLGSAYQGLFTKLKSGVLKDKKDRKEAKLLAGIVKKYDHKIVFPNDVRILESEDSKELVAKESDHIQADDIILDIGPETELRYADYIENADEIIWNGPLGVIESHDGKEGTLSLIDTLKKANGRTLVGGGDTLSLITNDELSEFDFVSTGGGAMLAYLAGEKMPGLDVLQ